MTRTNYYCVILAGGKGRRLWPYSRSECPKQFVDFFGTGKSLLQQTFERFSKIVPGENIFISTNKEYLHLVKEQLPKLPKNNILAEPIHRNTAPSMAWATHRIGKLNENASIVVTPADQLITDEDVFIKDIENALDFVAQNDFLLTMGIKPSRPEPGYGYIQLGEQTGNKAVCKVKSFTEKPERNFAKMFMESGEFYWNTGLFLSNLKTLRNSLQKVLPAVLRKFDKEHSEWTFKEEQKFINENFCSYPNMSLDDGILEKSDNVYVMGCRFGWADIGSWHAVYETKCKAEDDNVVIDSDVIFEDCRSNVVRLPKGKLAVINGLDGYIVAEHGNVLMICKKEDSSAMVRKFVNEVQMKRGDEYI